MARLTPPVEPESDNESAGAGPQRRLRAAAPAARHVEVSGDGLSAFASEQELAGRRTQAASARVKTAPPTPQALPPPRPPPQALPPPRPPPQALPAPTLSAPIWSAHEQPDRERSRFLIAALMLLVLAQSILIGWWWIAGRPLSAAQPVGESAAVTVTSEPAGAAVSVDGVSQGTTPVTLELRAGPHQVTVGEGSAGWTETLTVKAGVEASLHVARARTAAAAPDVPDVGTLEITTEPPGLQVTVDGTPRGASPVSVTDLSPGTHEVAVARGSSFVRRVVAVEAGVPTAVMISTQAEGITSGWLTVSGPVPVQIFENGALIGTSDAPRLLLPVGRHELEFTNDTFGYRVRRTVQITARQAAALALEPMTGTLSVNAQPWAEVWVDGRRIGETPIGNLSLPIGNHELTVRHPQLGERRQTVAVGANGPSRVGIDLRQ